MSISRLSEPKGYRSSSADPVGRTVLCAELPATEGDELWCLDDDALAELVRQELIAVGLPDPSPRRVHVERRRNVYVVHEVGFDRRQRVVDAWINGLPNVVALQRQALFASDNTHHALYMAYCAARCLSPGGFDDGAWQHYRQEFAAHVVED